MTYLSADAIFAADDIQREPVDVPEWGGTVLVQGMSGTDRDRFEASMISDKGEALSKDAVLANYRARLAASCMVDVEGKRLFRSDAEVRRLGGKSAQALTRVVEVASRLSGLTPGDVEELTGN